MWRKTEAKTLNKGKKRLPPGLMVSAFLTQDGLLNFPEKPKIDYPEITTDEAEANRKRLSSKISALKEDYDPRQFKCSVVKQ